MIAHTLRLGWTNFGLSEPHRFASTYDARLSSSVRHGCVNWYAGAACPRLLYAQHVEGAGKEFFNEICRCDLEGIVAKRKMGVYREDRSDWIKVKNKTYSQAEGRHELLMRRGRSG